MSNWGEALEKRVLLSATAAALKLPAIAKGVVFPAQKFAPSKSANLIANGRIYGQVINDPNGDGIQQSNEIVAIPRATLLKVYIDANNDGVYQTGETTVGVNAQGDFDFNPVPAGTHTLRLNTSGATAARLFQTGPVGGAITVTVSANTTTYPQQYFAVQQRAIVSGTVIHDLNGNGQIDPGETGAAGDVVFVDSNFNSTLDPGERSAVTNAAGVYSFDLPSSNVYSIRQQLPNEWQRTGYAEFANIRLGQDVTSYTVAPYLRKPVPPTFTVTGTLFIDENQNGVIDNDEQYTENHFGDWFVYADTNDNGQLDEEDAYTAWVDSFGPPYHYTITLPADGQTYRVRLRNEQDAFRTFTTAAYFDLSSTTPGQALSGYDFGLTPSATISGVAFEDSNANGRYDANEPGVTGRTLYLDTNNNGQYDAEIERTAYWDPGGVFFFLDIGAGTYHVREVLPQGVSQTTPPIDVTVAAGQTRGDLYIGTTPTVVTNPPPAPAWLNVSPGSVYLLSDNQLSVLHGTVTFTADAGSTRPDLSVNLYHTAHVDFATTQHLNALHLYQASSATLLPGGDKLLRVKVLTSANWIDLNDNDLIYDSEFTSFFDIGGAISQGYDHGTWGGTGLRSSVAKTQPGMVLGYMEGADYLLEYGNTAKFDGESITGTATVVRYTRAGDADLSGTVDFNDFLRLQNGFGTYSWFARGDFNYDGKTDFNDFLILQNNFGQSA